jgi:hypothetical protein
VTLEEAIHAHLTTAPSVQALIGTRVYPLLIPQTAQLPAVAYQVVSARRPLAHDGPTGLDTKLVQLTCQGALYANAKTVANAIGEVLNGFRGWLAGPTGVWCERIEQKNEIDGDEEFEAALVRCDFSFFYKE